MGGRSHGLSLMEQLGSSEVRPSLRSVPAGGHKFVRFFCKMCRWAECIENVFRRLRGWLAKGDCVFSHIVLVGEPGSLPFLTARARGWQLLCRLSRNGGVFLDTAHHEWWGTEVPQISQLRSSGCASFLSL